MPARSSNSDSEIFFAANPWLEILERVKVFSSTSYNLFELSWYVLRQGSLMALLSSSRILPPSFHLAHITYSLSKCFLGPSLQVWFCTHWWQGMASSLCYFPPKLLGTVEAQFKKKIWSLRNEICFLEKVNISFLPVTKRPVSVDSRLSSVTMILRNSSQEGEIAVTYEALFWGTGSKRKWFNFFLELHYFLFSQSSEKHFVLGKIYAHIKEDISIRTQ